MERVKVGDVIRFRDADINGELAGTVDLVVRVHKYKVGDYAELAFSTRGSDYFWSVTRFEDDTTVEEG